MTRSLQGAVFILASLVLAGCMAPMSQREAQSYAALSLRRYCTGTTPCSDTRFVKAERLKPGWLLDYESGTAKYGVLVRDDGNTEVSVWDKGADTVTR
jgi:hypothetical protein